VVGIMAAIAGKGGAPGIGLAIPSNAARLVMEQLIATGEVRRGVLGLTIKDLDDARAQLLGLTHKRGALVMTPATGGPADQAGIRAEDLILEFNGQQIEKAAHLKNLVAQTKPGTQVKLKIYRSGETSYVTVTLGESKAKAPLEKKPE